jgi:ribonuclease HI
MELAACIAAIEWVKRTRPATSRVQIFSDSRYVIDNIPRAHHWQRNDWRNAQGRHMEHSDLWRRFLAERKKAGVRVDFGWVKGKSSALLRKVDQAAKEAARTGTGVDRGYRSGKIGRPKTKGNVSTMFPAAGESLVIRVYGSRLVGRTDENRITFEIYDEPTNKCGPKHFAYAQPEVGAELHRQRAFRVQMNDNPKYPQVLRVLQEIPIPKTKKTGRLEPSSTGKDDSD